MPKTPTFNEAMREAIRNRCYENARNRLLEKKANTGEVVYNSIEDIIDDNDLKELANEVGRTKNAFKKQLFTKKSALNPYNTDEYKDKKDENVEEGIAAAFGSLATQTLAKGLGLPHSTVNQIAHALIKHVTPKVSAQRPHNKPAQQNKPHKQISQPNGWHPMELHHVFSGTPGEHEHSLDQAITHHNIATWNKKKGDHSAAEIHFRARDKHFKTYVTNAPRENLKKLNQEKVRSIFDR
jgi:hypothetical protein